MTNCDIGGTKSRSTGIYGSDWARQSSCLQVQTNPSLNTTFFLLLKRGITYDLNAEKETNKQMWNASMTSHYDESLCKLICETPLCSQGMVCWCHSSFRKHCFWKLPIQNLQLIIWSLLFNHKFWVQVQQAVWGHRTPYQGILLHFVHWNYSAGQFTAWSLLEKHQNQKTLLIPRGGI